jgi:hypothetical protein
MANNILKSLYNFVLTINIVLFFLFIIININNLDEIDIDFELMGNSFSFTLNFYMAVGIITVVYILLITMGISVFGSGLSDSGLHKMSKIITLLVLIALFTIVDSYFFLTLGAIGVYIQIFFMAIYFLHGITDISNENE